MQLEALIFDVDGTMADTERHGHRVAYNAAFAQAGLDWVWSEKLYGRLLAVSGGKERIRHYMGTHRPGFVSPIDAEAFVAGLHEVKTRHYTTLVRAGEIPVRPGVRRLLQEALGAGLRLAIATTTTLANVHALLETALAPDAASWFEVIGAGDVVPNKKPAPDIYRYVLDRMGLVAGRCMAFEDSVNGLCAARGAGLRTVVTVNDYTRDQDFSGAIIVLDHLGEVDRPFQGLAMPIPVDGARLLNLDLLRQLHGSSP